MFVDKYIDQLWGYIYIKKSGKIKIASQRAGRLLANDQLVGSDSLQTLPWLRLSWLTEGSIPRIVKTSRSDKLLLDILPDTEDSNYFHLYFRKLNDYRDTDHLWCEVTDSIIGVQKFIDTSYDGVMISDGTGKVLAVNNAFSSISSINSEALVGKNLQELVDEGTLPYSCTIHAIEQRKVISSAVRYVDGKEAVVSSSPLFDQSGRIIRVVSNIRDISELNILHEKLKSAKNLAKGLRRELKAIQITNTDTNRHLCQSHVMETLYDLAMKVADTDLPLLITGESGVGKSDLAKFVHSVSERNASGNFIHINCSAIPEALLESELFGYEEGAFTGANKSKVGLFELAHNGTLFLDEIGDMPLLLQAKILNILQENKFYRVGGTREVKVDTRIIAATNTKIEQLIAKGLFRRDLYYRLNVVPIRIPSLCERKEDLPPLISHYLDKANQKYKSSKSISPAAMELLLNYSWPGNIRELINLIDRMVVTIDEPIIDLQHLAEISDNVDLMSLTKATLERNHAAKNQQLLWKPNSSLKDLVTSLENRIIEEAIAQCGSLKQASQSLGVDSTTLVRKRNRISKIEFE
jgi:PAS domain S-box-containing protein